MQLLLTLIAGFFVHHGSCAIVKHYHGVDDCSSQSPSSTNVVKEGECVTLDTFVKALSADVLMAEAFIDLQGSFLNVELNKVANVTQIDEKLQTVNDKLMHMVAAAEKFALKIECTEDTLIVNYYVRALTLPDCDESTSFDLLTGTVHGESKEKMEQCFPFEYKHEKSKFVFGSLSYACSNAQPWAPPHPATPPPPPSPLASC